MKKMIITCCCLVRVWRMCFLEVWTSKKCISLPVSDSLPSGLTSKKSTSNCMALPDQSSQPSTLVLLHISINNLMSCNILWYIWYSQTLFMLYLMIPLQCFFSVMVQYEICLDQIAHSFSGASLIKLIWKRKSCCHCLTILTYHTDQGQLYKTT